MKGAIFDLDGTLLDSMQVWDTVGEKYLRSKGVVPCAGLREKLFTMSMPEAAGYFRNCCSITDSPQKIMDDINHIIEDAYYNTIPLKSGVAGMLRSLKGKNIKMCIATATDRHLAEAALKRNGILPYFEGIFTCTEVGHGKNRPDIYLAALELLGTGLDETYVFEDALYAIKTAKAAGFPTVGVYDRSAHACQPDIKALADNYLLSFDEWSV